MVGVRRGLAVVLAIALTGCSGGTSPEPGAVESAREPGVSETEAVAAVAVTREMRTLTGDVVQVDARPIDLAAAVVAGADEGRWSEAEGTADAILGFVRPDEARPGLGVDDVVTPGLSGLLDHARALLDGAGVPDDEQDRLVEAVAHLVPTPDVLDAVSRAADEPIVLAAERTSGTPRMVLARATAAGADDACADLAAVGFSARTSDGGQCYRHESELHDGTTLNLYYPGHWVDDPQRRDIVRLAGQAMRASVTTYRQVGLPAGDLDVVFSVHAHPERPSTEGVVGRFDRAAACPVTLFPAAEVTGSGSDRGFRQVVAHEIFHCSQHRALGLVDAADWWKEGSAEFFSNLVEPEADVEHRWASYFDANSADAPITALSYETAVFFQWYANVLGVDGVVALLQTVASGGIDGVSQMPELFHDFAVAYVAGAVHDTSGGRRWDAPALMAVETLPVENVTGERLGVDRYIVHRFVLEYARTKRFVQRYDLVGDGGRSVGGARLSAVEKGRATDVGAWSELPPELRSGCDEDTPWVLVSTAPSDAWLEVAVTDVEQGSCDPCLLGPWQMDLVTFTSYMTGVFDSLGVGAGLELVITGDYYMAFDEDLEVRMVRRGLTVLPFFQGRAAPATTIDGEDVGTYSTDGRSLRVFGIEGAASATSGGVTVGPFASDGPDGADAGYTCTDETLELVHDPYGSITLYRVEAIPEPDAVEVRTGSPERVDDDQ